MNKSQENNQLPSILDSLRPVVQFKHGVLEVQEVLTRGYVKPGMRARISSIEELDDRRLRVWFDFSEFNDYNCELESIFVDIDPETGKHKAHTEFELGNHPSQEQDFPWKCYLTFDVDDSDKILQVVSDEAVILFYCYLEEGTNESYVDWLERRASTRHPLKTAA